jgi:hypothetical protein
MAPIEVLLSRARDHWLEEAHQPARTAHTIVRGVLLPAAMKPLGERNWYLPRWLEWLPRLVHEEPSTAPEAEVGSGFGPGVAPAGIRCKRNAAVRQRGVPGRSPLSVRSYALQMFETGG